MTQTERILYRLNVGPMCSLEPLDWEPRITRTAARIQDLKDRGVNVMARECLIHDHPTAHHVIYELETIKQGSLFT
jgi:hypothetical protein